MARTSLVSAGRKRVDAGDPLAKVRLYRELIIEQIVTTALICTLCLLGIPGARLGLGAPHSWWLTAGLGIGMVFFLMRSALRAGRKHNDYARNCKRALEHPTGDITRAAVVCADQCWGWNLRGVSIPRIPVLLPGHLSAARKHRGESSADFRSFRVGTFLPGAQGSSEDGDWRTCARGALCADRKRASARRGARHDRLAGADYFLAEKRPLKRDRPRRRLSRLRHSSLFRLNCFPSPLDGWRSGCACFEVYPNPSAERHLRRASNP